MNTQEVRGCSTSFLETPVMNGATTEGAPTDRPGEEGNGGMTYTARAAGSQSTRSTRMPGVIPRTGGRGAGEGGHTPTGAVEAATAQDRWSRIAFRAVCGESSLHGSGWGSWKRAEFGRVWWSQSLTTSEERHAEPIAEATRWLPTSF